MKIDVEEFAKGCCLCSIYKHDNKGKNKIGVPRKILEPKYCWRIDICQGLNNVRGATSFLTMVDVYSGYVLTVPLTNENTSTIAEKIKNNKIKK